MKDLRYMYCKLLFSKQQCTTVSLGIVLLEAIQGRILLA